VSEDSQGSQQNEKLLEADDLLGVARSCVQEWERLEFPYRVAVEHDKIFRVGMPLAAHALNSTHVALDAWDRFPWVATASARVAFEHALVAQWAFLTPGGPEHFMRHVAHSNLVQAQDFARAIADRSELTVLVPEEDLADFQMYAEREPVPGSERSWNLRAMMSRFNESGLLYDSYRALSSAVHPSVGTIAAHFDFSAMGTPRVRRTGSAVADRRQSTLGLALAALWALNLIEKCAAGYSAPGRAGSIAIPEGLPFDLAHSDRGQP
jgi:hypothetical protein